MRWDDLDSGFGYLIGRIGLPGLAALWCVLFMIPCANAQSRLYRQLIALYLCAILSISYSPLTIKTASLLWFLFGAIAADSVRHVSYGERLASAVASVPARSPSL